MPRGRKERKAKLVDVPVTPRKTPVEECREWVAKLCEASVRTLLEEACSLLPSMILKVRFNVEEVQANPPSPQPTPTSPRPTPLATKQSWCVCGKCSDRHGVPEAKVCCGFKKECISESPTFMDMRRDMLARNRRPIRDVNSTLRHSSYKQFIYWRHGFLGRGNRKAVPSCCVWRIRREWPDENGYYVDFIPHTLDANYAIYIVFLYNVGACPRKLGKLLELKLILKNTYIKNS